VQLFHYHLVTRKAREVEARYVAKLGFELVARHGRVGDAPVSFEPGVSWEELDARGFRLRLSELERGAVNIVIQPGQWVLPRVDHLGVVLDEDAFAEVLERAAARGLRVQERSGRRTFVTTGLTGAATAVGEVLPELKGKLDGISMRVPTPNVSCVDLAAILGKTTTGDEVNAAFKAAADGPLKGILEYVTEPLVSIDFRGNAHSSIIDAPYTKVMDGDFVKVLAWYDNEWAYSNRCVDLLRVLVKRGI